MKCKASTAWSTIIHRSRPARSNGSEILAASSGRLAALSSPDMATSILHRMSEPVGQAWRRPLSITESLYVAFILFVFGTAYCQLYCALAMRAMNGMSMPLSLSMWRSAIETIPAFVAFELSKRVLSRGVDGRAFARVGAVLLLASALSVALVLTCHGLFFNSAMPLRLLIADRLPGMTITAVAIAWASREVHSGNASSAQSGCLSADALPPAGRIDWVRA